jgi:hypothetical protein
MARSANSGPFDAGVHPACAWMIPPWAVMVNHRLTPAGFVHNRTFASEPSGTDRLVTRHFKRENFHDQEIRVTGRRSDIALRRNAGGAGCRSGHQRSGRRWWWIRSSPPRLPRSRLSWTRLPSRPTAASLGSRSSRPAWSNYHRSLRRTDQFSPAQAGLFLLGLPRQPRRCEIVQQVRLALSYQAPVRRTAIHRRQHYSGNSYTGNVLDASSAARGCVAMYCCAATNIPHIAPSISQKCRQ